VVPESNYAEAAAREVLRALKVIEQAIGVLPAIKFNNQARAYTDEIRDESPDRHLASESIPTHASVAQVVPETPFGIRRVRA
jgi:hypothetical protein